MDRTLVLLRHAKSSWSDSSLRDFDRPLNKRGSRNAPAMGQLLKNHGLIPDLILTSDAVRAQTTARLAAGELGLSNAAVQTSHALYLASASTLLAVADEHGNDARTLYLVAHNPGMTDLANRISDARIDNLPTCGVFVVTTNASRWSDLLQTPGRFERFLCPKQDLD